jgi:hypothetical protein
MGSMTKVMIVPLVLLVGCAHPKTQSEVAASLVAMAQELAREGQEERARVLLENAKRLDPRAKEAAAPLRQPPTEGRSLSSASALPAEQVTLPYRFVWHGVEVKIASIEFHRKTESSDKPSVGPSNGNEDELLVNATLQERRGRTARLAWPDLLGARTEEGQVLPFSRYERAGTVSRQSHIDVAAHEQVAVTIHYILPVPAGSVRLEFATGKWWSSK